MNNRETYGKIIARCEAVRLALGMNKSRFAGEIGLKPQTYNNFIGAQASKPSVDLILGVSARFQVNAHWLLFKEGRMFRDGAEAAAIAASATNPDAIATNRTVLTRLEDLESQQGRLALQVERLEFWRDHGHRPPAASNGGPHDPMAAGQVPGGAGGAGGVPDRGHDGL